MLARSGGSRAAEDQKGRTGSIDPLTIAGMSGSVVIHAGRYDAQLAAFTRVTGSRTIGDKGPVE